MRWLDGITDSMDMSLGRLRGVGDEQGGLVCCSPWGHKESDRTERLNCIDTLHIHIIFVITKICAWAVYFQWCDLKRLF